MPAFLRVLLVDDSAFARKVIRELLAASPEIDVVGAARDGEEALELTAALRPDTVVCDLHMPRLNGVGFVRQQMRVRPLPILILSAAAQDAAEVMEALDAGAVDVVQKPSALATQNLRNIGRELVERLLGIAGVIPRSLPEARLARPAPPITHAAKIDVVVLGISTGGPQALRRMMPMFAREFAVPVAVVLHMPVGYTALYAEKLDEICELDVKEAEDGDALQSGRMLLAPAGKHLTFRRSESGVVAQLSMLPLEKIHRPSVDVLFRSAAETFRSRVLAVVMTGMGDDGREGAAWVKAQGGTVITESEKSCVIYGMPRSVAEAGLSDASFPLDEMAQAISSYL